MVWFSHKKRSVLGIDIGVSAIRMVELSRTEDCLCLESFALIPLTSSAIADQKDSDLSRMVAGLLKMLDMSATECRQACISVTAGAVMIKTLAMPSVLSRSEMEQQLVLEGQHLLSYPTEELALDFEIRQPVSQHSQTVDVVLVVCHKKLFEAQLMALRQSGIEVKVVEIDSFVMQAAINHWLAQYFPPILDHLVLWLDLAAASLSFQILKKRQVIFSHELHQAQLETDLAIEQLLSQTVSILQLSGVAQVDMVLVSGACATRAVITMLANYFKRPVIIINPFQQVVIAESVDRQQLLCDSTQLLLAYALALRGIQ